MKKYNSFPTQHLFPVLLSEELKGLWILLRDAESGMEFEFAMRYLEKIIRQVEGMEDQSGA